uniref:Uncharacterized protein n=1 Tax=Pararge aegeria TaxID=116150 RepID=S4NXJ9_9NEOP
MRFNANSNELVFFQEIYTQGYTPSTKHLILLLQSWLSLTLLPKLMILLLKIYFCTLKVHWRARTGRTSFPSFFVSLFFCKSDLSKCDI